MMQKIKQQGERNECVKTQVNNEEEIGESKRKEGVKRQKNKERWGIGKDKIIEKVFGGDNIEQGRFKEEGERRNPVARAEGRCKEAGEYLGMMAAIARGTRIISRGSET